MRVTHALQHLQLVIDHLLIAPHVLLQDDLDRDLALGAIRFPDDTIGSGTQCLSEAVSRSAVFSIVVACRDIRGGTLSIVAVGLTVQLVEHVCNCSSEALEADHGLAIRRPHTYNSL